MKQNVKWILSGVSSKVCLILEGYQPNPTEPWSQKSKKYLGDQIVQYSVLERVERLLEERFGNELVDHFIPEHFIPFAKKPVRVSIDPTHFSVVLTHVGAILKNFL